MISWDNLILALNQFKAIIEQQMECKADLTYVNSVIKSLKKTVSNKLDKSKFNSMFKDALDKEIDYDIEISSRPIASRAVYYHLKNNQPNWNESDPNSYSYIRNKPTILSLSDINDPYLTIIELKKGRANPYSISFYTTSMIGGTYANKIVISTDTGDSVEVIGDAIKDKTWRSIATKSETKYLFIKVYTYANEEKTEFIDCPEYQLDLAYACTTTNAFVGCILGNNVTNLYCGNYIYNHKQSLVYIKATPFLRYISGIVYTHVQFLDLHNCYSMVSSNGTLPDAINIDTTKTAGTTCLISQVLIPDGAKEMIRLYNCLKITRVVIPASITQFPSRGFMNCSNLTQVDWRGGSAQKITSVGANCFAGSSFPIDDHLAIDTTPSGLFMNYSRPNYNLSVRECTFTKFEYPDIFKGAQVWNTIYMPPTLEMIFYPVFEESNIRYEDFTNTKLTRIAGDAFKNCARLEYVLFPDSLVDIGDKVFTGCTNLRYVRFYGKIPPHFLNSTDEGDIFDECPALEHIYVPKGYVSVYSKCEWLANHTDLITEMNA